MTAPAASRFRAWGLFAGWLVVCTALFARPLLHLIQFALHNDDASHILLVPLIFVWLVFVDRENLNGVGPFDLRGAAGCIALAAMVLLMERSPWVSQAVGALTTSTIAFLLFAIAGFVAVFGRDAAKHSSFALGFLVFAVPLPQAVLNRVILGLQAGSAAVAGTIFDLCQVPALREGFVFHMPRISIQVAAECSGIRSSMALLILAVLIAHFAFRPFWKKALFVAAGFLLMILKNGVRIATLTILANYVDPAFLYGKLHQDGGIVFFLLALVILLPFYWLLVRTEHRSRLATTPGNSN